ncbi:hypothetical protein [Ktedonobacter racemifer]|uniref:Uncharacterized protein n=1 Tax=Ktedonobacter racemifer DSM 44963 TaxID=485913 RepID=D6U550_KTERA|nr:hypothetical protein [Ktedonobacter racemifer]EFH81630.1 hypothetical protein Krac_2366 [Ktedonobacter racemifer DSM 44963]
MATSTVQKRFIRVPANQAPKVQAVVADIQQAIAPYKPVRHLSDDSSTLIYEFQLSSAQDTTLQASMAGWAARLGVALLDTEVITVTAGH